MTICEPQRMSLAAKAYVGLILALGSAAMARGYVLWNPHDFLRFSVYLLLAAVASGLKIRLPGVMGTMSVLFVFVLTGIVELGLSETLIIIAICVIVQSYWRAKHRPQPVQILFNGAVLFTAATAADCAYEWEVLSRLPHAAPLKLALLASVFFVTNTIPVAAVIALTESRRMTQVWRDFFSWTFPYYLVGAALVGICSAVNRVLSWEAWILILPIVYAIYRSYRLYLDRLERQTQKAEDEKRHANHVAQLLADTLTANDALRRANTDLEQFAYAASHDLQEPLRMIAIYSQLLERRHHASLGPDGKQLLDTITEGSKRINALVQDLLSYTRVDSLDGTTLVAVSPCEVLEEVTAGLRDRISTEDASITMGDLAAVAVHRTHVVQLLQNLLSNSLKYRSPDRSPRIHISSTVQAANNMLQFTVQDNGIGIDAAYHEKIFCVFKRLHSRNVPGTGIGLAICRRIVELYGGHIWVESIVDIGSAFHFTLPASAASVGPCLDSGTGAACPERMPAALAGEHVRSPHGNVTPTQAGSPTTTVAGLIA
jgi:signal transduction histidine kinase